ncbi:MAG: septum formation initiator family protein [Hyphomicrobiales bacterium]
MAAINHPFPQSRRLPLPLGRPALNWWVLAAILIFGVGAMLPVLQASTATTRGFEVQQLQAQQDQLNGDIRQLEAEVANLTSLPRIERRANELGLVPAEDPIYITVDEPGPGPAKVPSEYLPGPIPQPEEPAPWWQSLFSWLPLGN